MAPLSANSALNLLSPRNQQLQALEIKRQVLKKYKPQLNLPQHIHMTNYSLKLYIEELFEQLKVEWNENNIPQHHKEIYAEVLRHIPKEQAVGFIQKEIQKVKNGTSFVQECMQYIKQREIALEELRLAADQLETCIDAKQRLNLIEMISQQLVHIRQITLYVVESICKWKDQIQLYLCNVVNEKKQPFTIAYSYYNDNYLLKIQTDMLEYYEREVCEYFNFSDAIDPFLMNLTVIDESRPELITHFIPKLALKRIEHLQERLEKELQFSEENEKCQQLLLFNPHATQFSQQPSSHGSSLMKLKTIKHKRLNMKTLSSINGTKMQNDGIIQSEKLLSRNRQRSLQPSISLVSRNETKRSPNSSQRQSPQKSRIKNLPVRFDKGKQMEEISIQPCKLTEDQLQLYIKDYFDQFKTSVDEENPFLKSFPFDHIEVMTEVKTQQETNAFFINFRDFKDKRGLLITHIDRFNFDERKLIISHLSVLNLDFDTEVFLYEKVLIQIKKFLFQSDPCSEIQIALVTIEKDDFMFEVNQTMESIIKQSQFIQVEFQDDYETQLYYSKRPQNQPKKQLLQQIEPVFFEIQSCITLKDQSGQATPLSSGQFYFHLDNFLFQSIFLQNLFYNVTYHFLNTDGNSINNGLVNIALLCDLQKGDLKQEINSIECDWKKIGQFDNLCKEYELVRDIQHSEYQLASGLSDYLNRQNSIFDFSDRLKDKKQVITKYFSKKLCKNSNQFKLLEQIDILFKYRVIFQMEFILINHYRRTPLCQDKLCNFFFDKINTQCFKYLQMIGYSNIYQTSSPFMYNPIYLIETHHTNTFFFIVQLENDQQQKDFDDLCIDLGQREIVLQELNPIEDEKNIVIPQFSLKQKRERKVTDNLIMYEQLIFSNDFEPSMKSIKYKPYDSTKDILIMKPFVYGMLNIDIISELDSILFAGVYK